MGNIENLHEVGMGGIADFPSKRLRVWNRTGAATVVNRVYQFDMGFTVTAAESTANSEGDILPAVTHHGFGKNGAMSNIVPFVSTLTGDTAPAAGNRFCVADESVADNEQLWVTIEGEHNLVIHEGTTSGVVRKPWCKIVMGGYTEASTGVAATTSSFGQILTGSGGGSKVIARNLASVTLLGTASAYAASNEATVNCYFNGINGCI